MIASCDYCAATVVNGTPCHEIGCPDEHIDLRTGIGKLVECFECGWDYPCESREEYRNRQRICPDCQYPEYEESFQ